MKAVLVYVETGYHSVIKIVFIGLGWYSVTGAPVQPVSPILKLSRNDGNELPTYVE